MDKKTFLGVVLGGIVVIVLAIFSLQGSKEDSNQNSNQNQPVGMGTEYNLFTSVATTTGKTIGPGCSTQVLATSTGRQYAYLANNGPYGVYCNFGMPGVLNRGIYLVGSSTYEILPSKLWTGSVECITNGGASSSMTVIEK